MDVYPIADNFCHYMLIVKHCPYYARLPVRKFRHCVVQMNRMIGPGRKCSRCSFIISIGMRKGNIHPVFYFLNEFNCITALFRSHPDKFHKPIGCFQEGHNGHIGFNEPGAAFEKETHCVDLTESTIEANKRFFASEDDVPRQAYTMGIKNIMQAKKILVVVSGEDKADILKEVLYGAITPQVPASILQLHNDVTIVADEAALSKIK